MTAQLAIDGVATNSADTCHRCGAPTRRIIDEPVCGLTRVIDAQPVTRDTALAAVIAGRHVVYGRRTKTGTDWHRWEAGRIRSGADADADLYVVHQCRATFPAKPTATVTATTTEGVPF